MRDEDGRVEYSLVVLTNSGKVAASAHRSSSLEDVDALLVPAVYEAMGSLFSGVDSPFYFHLCLVVFVFLFFLIVVFVGVLFLSCLILLLSIKTPAPLVELHEGVWINGGRRVC